MDLVERVVDLPVRGRRIAAALHDAGEGPLVLFCHGFRGERTGPNRSFVRAARVLAEQGISSLRFDQPGSGDSDGDFSESRFDDWVATIDAIAHRFHGEGRAVALFGQSMGASAALVAAASLPVRAVVGWVPDPNTEPYEPDGSGFMEEGGQRVGDGFWQQAVAADVVGALRRVPAPVHLLFGTDDECVSPDQRAVLVEAARPGDLVEVHEGWTHSAWTFDRTEQAIAASTGFLAAHLDPA